MYSQNGEDTIILKVFEDCPTGKFLDIGAFDGRTFSNTLALVERGWSGVLVEPGIPAFQSLLKLHSHNPRLELVQAVVSVTSNPASFTKFWDCGDLYSTTESGNFHKWEHYAKDHGKPFRTPYWVPQIPLLDLFRKFPGPYDLISIDTEGTSLELFRDLMKFIYPDFPSVLVVEHDGHQPDCLSTAGVRYKPVVCNTENIVFVRQR